jgi:hypothetical protein
VTPQTGQQLKQLGLDLVTSHNQSWTDDMLEKLRAFCKARVNLNHPTFVFEEFRDVAIKSGWEQPKTPKCWGALATAAAKRGIIKSTGNYQKAMSPATHAHPVLVWSAL